MKCYNHNDHDAVAACLSCGKGLCVSCVDVYEKPFCERCADAINAEIQAENTQILQNNIYIYKKTIVKKIIGIIWNAFFLVSGIIAYIAGSKISSGEAIAGLIMNWGFSGLPWLLTSSIFKSSESQKTADVVMAAVSPGAWLIGGLVKLVIGFIIGAIASPFLLIISIVILKKSFNSIHESKNQLSQS